MHSSDYPMFNRRHFLKHLMGFSAMALPGMAFVERLRAAAPALKKQNKSLIVLWMSGGPSHMDTWDLKPDSQNGGGLKPNKNHGPPPQNSPPPPTPPPHLTQP